MENNHQREQFGVLEANGHNAYGRLSEEQRGQLEAIDRQFWDSIKKGGRDGFSSNGVTLSPDQQHAMSNTAFNTRYEMYAKGLLGEKISDACEISRVDAILHNTTAQSSGIGPKPVPSCDLIVEAPKLPNMAQHSTQRA